MRGYPKFLNSKEDYEYVRKNFPKQEWEKDFRALLENCYDWYFVKNLESEAAGVIDDTHKVVENEQDGAKTYAQYEYKHNDNCKLDKLGYTKAEVEKILEV